MSPSFSNAVLAFVKGSDPPLKGETETTDDFQTRSIEWIKGEFKTFRALLWAVIALQLNAQFHLVGF